ncbi:GTP-binding protein [Polaribacter batillariae]|uniref:GTP-binding protein n=1 Tax=Polaribacter batillariae TaxID=2808900 RepID=A0ABX7STS2_9FLAO|nr:GTP-binding protein [Polaribacter batillariae]QTD36750.1 GTP-binding protein [Polaribacter batillariae]
MSDKKTLLIEKRNSELFLRPRFSINLEENAEVILSRFSEAFQKGNHLFRGSIVDGHIFISVPKKEEHFWSPQLHLEIIEKENNNCELKGLFGPKPQVWTLFMFVHFVLGISFLGFCVLLYTRLSLDESLLLPIIMLIALPLIWVLLYFLGQIGKDTGKSQMKNLHDFMLRTIYHLK